MIGPLTDALQDPMARTVAAAYAAALRDDLAGMIILINQLPEAKRGQGLVDLVHMFATDTRELMAETYRDPLARADDFSRMLIESQGRVSGG